MELLVSIKQVPDTSEIKLDPETNTLIRTGLPSIVNPFDLHALEEALAIKDKHVGTRVTVITMGPPQAKEALRECLALGADEAYLVTDRAFGGADTLATSYTLASAIKYIEKEGNFTFDMIFAGKQAIDGDTAQVGPQIAEELGIPQVTYACQVTVEDDHTVTVKREHEEGFEILNVDMPLLITAVKELNEPRLPRLWNSIYAKRYQIRELTRQDLPVDDTRLGLNGSPTRVRKVYQPPIRSKAVLFEGKPAETVGQLKEALQKRPGLDFLFKNSLDI